MSLFCHGPWVRPLGIIHLITGPSSGSSTAQKGKGRLGGFDADASVMAWKWRKVSIKVIWLVVEPTLLKNISQIGSFPQVGMKMKNIWNHHLVIFWLFYIPYPGKWHPIIHQGIIIVNNRRGICCFGGELLFFWNMLVGRHNLLWELCNAHEYFRGAKVAEIFHNFPASILQIRTHP